MFFISIETIVQELIGGIAIGSIYIAIALGLTLVYGILKILHIAHAGIYVLGAYFGYFAYIYTESILLALLAGAFSAIIFGLIIERIFYLPLLNQPRYVPLVISIALFILIEETVANVFGHHPKGLHVNLPSISYNIYGIVITFYQIFVISIVFSLTFLLWIFINKTKIGLASKAAIQDTEIIQTTGVNLKKVIDFNFIIGSALAGLAGVLVGIYFSLIYPFMGDVVAYKGLVVIVLGGFGSIGGAILGGLILGISESFLISNLGFLLPREAFAFIILILLLIFRPQGILGKIE